MKLTLCFFLLHMLPFAVNAQEDKCAKADSIIAGTNTAIARVKTGGMENWGVLYCNSVEINTYKDQWRAVGNYNSKIDFWYTDAPEFAVYEEKTKESVLAKITVTTESSAYKFYYEFYYSGGELVAANATSDTSAPTELKYYFNNLKLIKFVENGKISTTENALNSPEIISMSSDFVSFFLTMFLKSTH